MQTPSDPAVALRKVLHFEMNKSVPAERRVSFLFLRDNSLLLVDNINGKLFKISPDFRSAREFGTTTLSSPTRIRAFDSNFHVYDNTGISIFEGDGKFVKTIKPFLKLEDFDLIDPESYVVSLAEQKIDNEGSYLATLNSAGKRTNSIGKLHASAYQDLENKAFIEVRDGRLYVGYKYRPEFEVYDIRNMKLLNAFPVTATIFPDLIALKQDKEFSNPEPGIFKIAKFIAGFTVFQDRLYVLLHTPNPVIVEFTLDGKELQRFISRETQALDYFGFDVRLINATKRFFVGTIDYSSNPAIVVYEENGN